MDELLATAKEALKNGDAAAKQAAYEALLAGFNQLVPTMPAAEYVNVARDKSIVARWKSDNSNAASNSDRPVGMGVDGVKNTTDNYAEFGANDRTDSSYLQVDLGDVYDVAQINLVRYFGDGRTYPNTTIVMSEDDSFDTKDAVVYNSDADNMNGFGKGEDTAYPETDKGRSFDAKGAKARYVRVYMSGQYKENKNTNHIVELEVMVRKDQGVFDPFGIETLDALIARGETVVANADKYTAESIADVKAALDAAKPVADKVRAEIAAGSFTVTHGEFNAACDALRNALNCVQPKPEQPKPVEFSVTFDDCWPDTQNIVVFVPKDGKVARPADPTREGWKFEGWFTDTELKNAYDFETPVTGDLVLYAKWAKVSVPGGGSDEPVKPADPQKPGSNDGLAQTGDLSMIAALGASLAGVAAIGIGGASKRRR